MKINNITKAALIAASLILASGCSYRPPLVEAKIPLIASQNQTKGEDVCLSSLPDSLTIGEALVLFCPDETAYVVTDIYTSALGQYCATLSTTNKEVSLCAVTDESKAKNWFTLEPVMSGM
ncbi:hypothetical protein [Enterovibrio norvegicus]|uniref:hypothetical protein n=1 Tax=Enterovibrio norvegicus TaxID=188144 RepID=UPI00030E8360|nr:hypothetical protein [Enterovibrio norvegicus]OEF58605.1 hypothetical protein A1OU_10600 [Enterovibrio norvegicus]